MGEIVRLTQIDGKLPNLALMRLAAHYRAEGFGIAYTKHVERGMWEPDYAHVFGSAIFSASAPRVDAFRREFPRAVVGGTWDTTNPVRVEDVVPSIADRYDYSICPDFTASMGFTARGCRFKCGFCVVPKKEGRPASVNTVADIWRGAPWPKHLHLLDNDFFGQPREQWEARVAEIRDGGFKVCFNQGINIRMVDPVSAAALASVHYSDDSFKRRRLYTAWDNIGDEGRFFRGVETLGEAGIPPTHLMAYMLVGYDRRETWERVLYRFGKMVARGIRPYPMIFGDRHRTLAPGGTNERLERRTLGEFQRWAVGGAHTQCRLEHYDASVKRRPRDDGQMPFGFGDAA